MGEPKVRSTSSLFEKVRGWVFSLVMMKSAFFGSVYVLMPISPLIFLQPRWFRRIVDRLVGFWVIMPAGIIEHLFGARLYVSGDIIEHSTPALIIMNHRTRLDWLFFWSALFRMDPWLLTSEKISLKGILKYLPGAGWAMLADCFLFLHRQFSKDKLWIGELIDYYADSGNNYQLLLFPEGTDKCPKATARSLKYAEENNLPHYQYVLHPRTTGFTYILEKMRKAKYIDHLYDVTVAYSDSIVQSEIDLVCLGLCPREVHFDVRKIPIQELPEGEEELGEWLKDLWKEKEERLRQFYAQPHGHQRLDTTANAKQFKLTPLGLFIQLSSIFIWLSLTVLWIYAFISYSHQYWLAFLAIAFFVGAQKWCGGAEVLISRQATSWNRRQQLKHVKKSD